MKQIQAKDNGRAQLLAGEAGAVTVWATHLDRDDWQVSVDLRANSSCGLVYSNTYVTAAQARELAAALIRAADHYDAETARLAAQAVQS